MLLTGTTTWRTSCVWQSPVWEGAAFTESSSLSANTLWTRPLIETVVRTGKSEHFSKWSVWFYFNLCNDSFISICHLFVLHRLFTCAMERGMNACLYLFFLTFGTLKQFLEVQELELSMQNVYWVQRDYICQSEGAIGGNHSPQIDLWSLNKCAAILESWFVAVRWGRRTRLGVRKAGSFELWSRRRRWMSLPTLKDLSLNWIAQCPHSLPDVWRMRTFLWDCCEWQPGLERNDCFQSLFYFSKNCLNPVEDVLYWLLLLYRQYSRSRNIRVFDQVVVRCMRDTVNGVYGEKQRRTDRTLWSASSCFKQRGVYFLCPTYS